MKLDVTVDLSDMVHIMREALEKTYPEDEVGSITVASYGKQKIHIDEFNMVTCEEFRHRAKEV